MGVKSITTCLLVGLAILSFVSKGTAQAEDIAVVVNSNNPATNISLGDLRKIFAGAKRTWPGGQPIKLITRSSGCPERNALLKLLAMSESEYKQYWRAQVFRGEADAEPLIVPSVGMQKEALNVFAGGITLVNVREVKPGMKVVKVDDLLPGESRYALR
jgi:periplasmic binding family protein